MVASHKTEQTSPDSELIQCATGSVGGCRDARQLGRYVMRREVGSCREAQREEVLTDEAFGRPDGRGYLVVLLPSLLVGSTSYLVQVGVCLYATRHSN